MDEELEIPTGQIARWLQFLETYNLQVTHRPGYQHINADFLSRNPCRSCQREEENSYQHDDLTEEQAPSDELQSENEEDYACNPLESYPVRAITRQQFQEADGFKESQLTLLGWTLDELRLQQL